MEPKKINTFTLFLHTVVLKYLLLLSFIIGSLFVFSFFLLETRHLFLFYFSGILVWTLFEYLLNRFAFHQFSTKGFWGKIALHHKMHHEAPQDPRYIMMPISIILISSLIISFITCVLAEMACLPLLSGFLTGYIIFIIIHTIVHHQRPENAFLDFLWNRHTLNHKVYADKAFAVSIPLWDQVFGTVPKKHSLLSVDNLQNATSKIYHTLEVDDAKSEKAFYSVPSFIYRDDPFYIAPLESEIKAIFDEKKNSYYQHGDAKRWVLIDQNGIVSGRIAAFVNFPKMNDGDLKTGGIGFFECINDKKAAFALFDTAMDWLKENHNVQAIDGPINFGENDKFWGLLVDGFDYPSYGMNYNPPYYLELFEAYGFQVQYYQFTNKLDLRKPLAERFVKIAERVQNNSRYSFRHFSYRNKEKFVNDFVEIYNQAWASFKNFHPLEKDYLRRSLTEIKLIVEESFIWFVYVDNKPAGLLVGMPDVNELLKYVNGKLNMWNKGKFFILKYMKGFTISRVVIMGVIPQYQNLGLESGLILNAFNAGKKLKCYKSVQLAWVGDFNNKMIAIHNAMGAVSDKKHATLRKVLV
jgi:sterol desaturase/sphingolipid hydroxylase (fatty acid hydroxylase superfamily)